jgi:AmiR/NasT family two-component response regulator
MGNPESGSQITGRIRRPTSDLLRNLRELRVALLHPKDADGEMLTRQLQRIGCQVQGLWPPPTVLPDTVDVVFLAVRPESPGLGFEWLKGERSPTLVTVIGYENPTVVNVVLVLGAHGVLTAPVRSSGILSTLVVAMARRDDQIDARKRIARLEQKLQSANQISEAKTILMRNRGIGSEEAYRIIRELAMSKRVPIEEIARAVIHADAILSFGKPPAS